MFDEDEGVTGITPELLVEDLNFHDAGYILEVTTDDTDTKVVVTTGQFDDETRYAEIDFGDVDEINDILDRRFSNDNCIRVSGEDNKTLTIISDGGLNIVHDSVENEAEELSNKQELANWVENWVANHGKLEQQSDLPY